MFACVTPAFATPGVHVASGNSPLTWQLPAGFLGGNLGLTFSGAVSTLPSGASVATGVKMPACPVINATPNGARLRIVASARTLSVRFVDFVKLIANCSFVGLLHHGAMNRECSFS